MANFILDNGIKAQKQKKVMVFKCGQMAPSTKASGIMTWLEVSAASF